jgi:hypothetical protein
MVIKSRPNLCLVEPYITIYVTYVVFKLFKIFMYPLHHSIIISMEYNNTLSFFDVDLPIEERRNYMYNIALHL